MPVETAQSLIAAIGGYWQNQLGGVFLAPGSTFSLFALIATGMVAAGWMIGKRPAKRPLRAKALIRALFPRRLWRSRSGRADIGWFLFSLLGGGAMIGWAVLTADVVDHWLVEALVPMTGAGPMLDAPAWLAGVIAAVALFVAYEFAYWLDHSLMHRFDWTWEIHKVHHSADHLSLLTISRVHPLETIGFYNIVGLCMGVTGGLLHILFGPAAAPISYGGTNLLVLVSAIVIVHLQHSHLWMTFGPRWGRLLLGPAHHQIHHSDDPAHFNRNFGNLLTVFDRMFGTFHMPAEKRGALRFGTGDGADDPHSLWAMSVRPVQDSARAIAKAFAGRADVAGSSHAGERA
jgi:sterol desaturase/sphingolipid hydroxylase (fatty acid hydroxylase superfamily)